MTWVPPPAFHGTINFAVLHGIFGAATDAVGASDIPPANNAAAAIVVTIFFICSLPDVYP